MYLDACLLIGDGQLDQALYELENTECGKQRLSRMDSRGLCAGPSGQEVVC